MSSELISAIENKNNNNNINNFNKVKELLNNKKINVNLQNKIGHTALIIAVFLSKYNIVVELLKHPKINVNLHNYKNATTSLMYAASLGKYNIRYLNIVKELLKHPKINVNLQDKPKGRTALIIDCEEGNLEMVKELLKNSKINVNLQNEEDQTAFMIAQKKGHDKIEKLLSKYEKIKIQFAREKIEKQMKTEKQRSKKTIQKQKTRTKNLSCKNDIDFILQEDIEDIPTSDLVYIKLNSDIYCFEKSSFSNMLKYSQPVRGNCRPTIPNQSLDCDLFYPINVGFNVYITKKNYNEIKNNKNQKKWELKNKRQVDFTTGLHIMSEKSGKDNVYDLVFENYQIGGKKRIKFGSTDFKTLIKRLGGKKKKIRKHSGINQKTGRLKKGYRYSGKRVKSKLPEIMKNRK